MSTERELLREELDSVINELEFLRDLWYRELSAAFPGNRGKILAICDNWDITAMNPPAKQEVKPESSTLISDLLQAAWEVDLTTAQGPTAPFDDLRKVGILPDNVKRIWVAVQTLVAEFEDHMAGVRKELEAWDSDPKKYVDLIEDRKYDLVTGENYIAFLKDTLRREIAHAFNGEPVDQLRLCEGWVVGVEVLPTAIPFGDNMSNS